MRFGNVVFETILNLNEYSTEIHSKTYMLVNSICQLKFSIYKLTFYAWVKQ